MLTDDPAVRPAITKKACSLEERAARLKTMRLRHHDTIRLTLMQVREMGIELLAAKDQCTCENKPWHKWLEKTNTHPDTASKWMRIAEYWTQLVEHTSFSRETTIADALSIISSLRVPATNGTTGTTAAESRFCRKCRLNGPSKSCPDCASMRAEREPGEPTQEELEEEEAEKEEEKQKPKVGAELFVWRKFDDEYGKVVRFVDQFGNAYKVKEDPATEELRKLLNEFHKRFKKLYAKVAKQKAPAE